MNFNKNERWGLTIWSIVILLISFGFTNFNFLSPNTRGASKIEEYIELLDSMAVIKENTGQTEYMLSSFDPNQVTASELQKMGIDIEIAERWVNFRNTIGQFKDHKDILKIYGLDSNLFLKLKPYINFSNPTVTRKINNTSDQHSHPPGNKHNKGSGKGSSNIDFVMSEEIDLNTCSAEELEHFGFQPYIARRIVNYRKKVSPYYSVKDLYKIYDIDTHLVEALQPRLNIHHDKLNKIDLNTATADELKALPGIGDVYSQRIIAFRDHIGRFHSIQQLLDVYGIDPELLQQISDRMTLKEGVVKKININHASIDELAKHPYISWDLAERIINYRAHHFPLDNLNKLIGIDTSKLKKLKPYISYESVQVQEE